MKISENRKKIMKRLFKIMLVIIGIIIIVFNDTFGKLEGFAEFIAFYFIIVFITIAYWIFKQIKSIFKLRNEKEKTELLHLKSQVNPHFFFNTLNNLYGMMEKNSKEREMVLKLSDMMRYSIYEGEKDWVTLKNELDYLQNYIELQEIRYHKKSDVQFNHTIENPDAKVMPLLFIILLENAFKHGLENLEKDAYIHIDFTESENEVQLVIENNFDLQQTKNQEGIGLKNLKRRLELVYPKRHSLSFDINNTIYKVTLSLTLK
ncbi:GHKL domain-containing protein [Polaribacter dokdonensis DSW-5]|uniref:GHKL domain-containing protein n=2 Tax=Polaribacter dokdonensis DSW-5 TaxID=1300348 RepID=A0A1H5JZB2_9FLAO|nr:GHKL domain-containing protein [Polaribacter dokdonensis DSW-5]|tara:strand:+ start:5715 stop:6500 length:786 start_codon:yes stop_codon:yes gene_type:complete